MKRLLFFAVPLLFLLALPAGAGTGAAAGEAKPVKPRALVAKKGLIHAFAQDGDTIGWIGADGRVSVRQLSTGKTWVVGAIPTKGRASTAVLALAGRRALWSWDDGGNSTAYPIVTGAPGHASVKIADLGGGLRFMGDGLDLSGLAGDGTTLAYGWVAETCPNQPVVGCQPPWTDPLVVTGGGVSPASWMPPTRPPRLPLIPNIPPPALFAVSQGGVAAVPARASTPAGEWVPRVAEDGPVEVYDLSGRLLLRVPLLGIIRDVALSGPKLAVILELPDGAKRIEQFVVPNENFVSAARVPQAARDLGVGSAGTIFRVGHDIYVLRSEGPRLLVRAAGTPIGLSIEGRRIAWAENVKGRGRIVALTLR
jgi:hypothetical protein